MADTLMMNVPENFDLAAMAEKVKEDFQMKGFTVSIMKMKNSVRIKFDRKCGGINMLLGLGQGITVTCMVQGGDNLVVNYSDGDWTGKIVGLVVGWFLCSIPFWTALVGSFKQLGLPKKINDSIMMAVNN